MMTRANAESRIRRELNELEEAQNIALAKAAALTLSVALARNLPDVPATLGQPIILRMASLTGHLTQGAGDVARVHAELAAIGREMGLLVPDDNGKCPPQTGLVQTDVKAV